MLDLFYLLSGGIREEKGKSEGRRGKQYLVLTICTFLSNVMQTAEASFQYQTRFFYPRQASFELFVLPYHEGEDFIRQRQ